MLRSVGLTNFKCFDSVSLACAPLTLLCGGNGVGKSSVIQSLLVLRQSYLTGELQAGRLVLGGELTDLGTGQDVLCESAERDAVAFELHAVSGAGSWRQSFTYLRASQSLEAAEEGGPEGTGSLAEWDRTPPLGGRVVYISADRIGPRKSHLHHEVFARRGDIGARGEYALNYLAAEGDEMMARDDPRRAGSANRRLSGLVDHWLQQVTPGAHLQMETIQHADVIVAGFAFDRPGDVRTRPYRATNVGFGLSYTLPVLTSLMAPAGTMCLIENPEAHLHPLGQTRLGELAVRAAIAGVQVITETHSDHFMDGVRIAVRDGLIQPDQVAFHYFDREGGKTRVSSPQVDAEGRLSAWPVGFFDQHEENLARLLAPRP